MSKNQIKLYVKHLDLSKIVDKGNSIQNEARRLRYQWFGEVIRDLNADVLLTAHHLDDQLETILYRVLSGRSTRSSLGMSDISNYEDYLVCRPLLNIYKKTSSITKKSIRFHILKIVLIKIRNMLEMIYDNGLSQVLITIRFLIPITC